MAQRHVEWSRMTAPEIGALAERDAIVLLPVASTEQHGPHLATGCDALLAQEVVRRTAALVSAHRPILCAPVVWTGLAQHHVSFGATFTLSLATYHALLRDIVLSIKGAGFTKVLIVNAHGGNIAALNILTDELTRETALAIATTTYIRLADDAGDFVDILEDQPSMGHACEAETSMMMALAAATGSELVRQDMLPKAYQEGYHKDAYGSAAVPPPPALLVWRSFKDMTASGVRGDARRASAEKGERLFKAVSERLAEQLIAGAPWEG